MKRKLFSRKNIARAGIVVIFLAIIWDFFWGQYSRFFSEEKHFERVSKRVEQRISDNGFELANNDNQLTDYIVYSLYTEDDKLGFFLVEFEPYGYLYVQINKSSSIIFQLFGGANMYTLNSFNIYEPWQRTDGNGELVYYHDSHFKVAGIEDEKRYLLLMKQDGSRDFIPAIKSGGKYLNLISMEEMEYEPEISSKKNAVSSIRFIAKGYFDL